MYTDEDITINIIRRIRKQINSRVSDVSHTALSAQRNA